VIKPNIPVTLIERWTVCSFEEFVVCNDPTVRCSVRLEQFHVWFTKSMTCFQMKISLWSCAGLVLSLVPVVFNFPNFLGLSVVIDLALLVLA